MHNRTIKPTGVTLLFNIWCDDTTEKKLQDAKLLTDTFLIDLVRALNMTPIEGTSIFKEIPVPDSDEISVSASIMLLESHACLHSWPEHQYMRLEVSTCKNVDEITFGRAVDYIEKFFKPRDIEIMKQEW